MLSISLRSGALGAGDMVGENAFILFLQNQLMRFFNRFKSSFSMFIFL
jgi:hypothetical protein